MTNIDVLESGGANMTGQTQKHAVTKTFINFFFFTTAGGFESQDLARAPSLV